jgi:hypothetical protein
MGGEVWQSMGKSRVWEPGRGGGESVMGQRGGGGAVWGMGGGGECGDSSCVKCQG